MILQNKQTGVLGVLEATTYHGGRPDNIIEVYEMGMGGAVRVLAQYNTLEELLGEWEDYKPKEPLIKHEKIRNTFRDWCVENGLDESEFRYYNNGTLRSTADDNYSIWFLQLALHARLQEGIDYTFTDLCGEEER